MARRAPRAPLTRFQVFIKQTNKKQEAVTHPDPDPTPTNKSLNPWLYVSRGSVQLMVRGPEAVGGRLAWVRVFLTEGHHVISWILLMPGVDVMIWWSCVFFSCFSDQTSDSHQTLNTTETESSSIQM